MVRYRTFFRYSFFLLWLLTAGCAQVSEWASGLKPSATVGQFNFDWSIKGDKRVVPLQVFDDGRQTWLQFGSGVPVPALFARSEQGDTLLAYEQSGAYVLLPGVWPHLVVQGGQAQGHLYRQAKAHSVAEPEAVDVSKNETDGASKAEIKVSEPDPAPLTLPVSAVKSAPITLSAPVPLPVFEVGPANGTMRETLVQWARLAKWDFGPEHWAVDIDIPIVGSAQFNTSFEEAVRALVASSELGDRPLQPCFYANRVLRVVPFAQPCNRARTMASAS